MKYFLAKNDRQLGICLRMLFANEIQWTDQVIINDKDKVEFHIYANADDNTIDELQKLYKLLIS